MSPNLSDTTLSLKEALEYYEDGKHRRYALLFAVNGGAFAVAKLLTGEASETAVVLGSLTLLQLALGMALFTCVMVWDIFVFGDRVRTTYLEDVFSSQGKIVLLLVGALLLVGWVLVSGVCRCGA